MGGFGSGSRLRSEFATTSSFVRLSIRDFPRTPGFRALQGWANPVDLEISFVRDGMHYQWQLWPGYRTGTNVAPGPRPVPRKLWLSDTSAFVALTSTVPRFGGRRFWFVCPRSRCGRRCSVLYREPISNARAFA